jgi:hypothetical protein
MVVGFLGDTILKKKKKPCGCFCKFGFWVSFERFVCFEFGAEPVELLLDKNCNGRIKLRLLALSQLRLLLLLNCQKDFDGGLSSTSKLPNKNSFSLFFSVFTAQEGREQEETGLDPATPYGMVWPP